MARKRKYKRKSKSKKSNTSIKNMAKGWVNKLAGPVVFWQQLSSKDYEVLNQSDSYRQLDYLNKGKVAVNILVGSLQAKEYSLSIIHQHQMVNHDLILQDF